jgi:hypothetical protein
LLIPCPHSLKEFALYQTRVAIQNEDAGFDA